MLEERKRISRRFAYERLMNIEKGKVVYRFFPSPFLSPPRSEPETLVYFIHKFNSAILKSPNFLVKWWHVFVTRWGQNTWFSRTGILCRWCLSFFPTKGELGVSNADLNMQIAQFYCDTFSDIDFQLLLWRWTSNKLTVI